jgi:hypothetical protein
MSDTWEDVTLDDISEDITVGHVGPMGIAPTTVELGKEALPTLSR